MNKQCETVRYILVEHSGARDLKDPVVDSHLEECKDCRRFVATEARLVEVLEAASPPADPPLQERVIHAVQILDARRRRLALAPVAASSRWPARVASLPVLISRVVVDLDADLRFRRNVADPPP